jgi:hypothetical protein
MNNAVGLALSVVLAYFVCTTALGAYPVAVLALCLGICCVARVAR